MAPSYTGQYRFCPYSTHGKLGGGGGASGVGGGVLGGGGDGGHVQPGNRQTVRESVSLYGSGSMHSTSPLQQGSAAEHVLVVTLYTGHQRFCPCVEQACVRRARASTKMMTEVLRGMSGCGDDGDRMGAEKVNTRITFETHRFTHHQSGVRERGLGRGAESPKTCFLQGANLLRSRVASPVVWSTVMLPASKAGVISL